VSPAGDDRGHRVARVRAVGPPRSGEQAVVIVARDFKTSSWIEIEIRNGIIAAVRPGDGPAERSPNDDWVGPAFWDIQLNGRWGHSFSSPELTVEHVVAIGDAAAAGAKLSTHLGNGIAAQLQRHPNPIWRQAADDALFASLIADGHHLDCATLRVLARAKGTGEGDPDLRTPAHWQACRRGPTGRGTSIPPAGLSWPARPTSQARTGPWLPASAP